MWWRRGPRPLPCRPPLRPRKGDRDELSAGRPVGPYPAARRLPDGGPGPAFLAQHRADAARLYPGAGARDLDHRQPPPAAATGLGPDSGNLLGIPAVGAILVVALDTPARAIT